MLPARGEQQGNHESRQINPFFAVFQWCQVKMKRGTPIEISNEAEKAIIDRGTKIILSFFSFSVEIGIGAVIIRITHLKEQESEKLLRRSRQSKN